jgi:hypothetical protein
LTLTHNGRDLDNPAAIQYFCHEFLGINTQASTAERDGILQQAMDVPQDLIRGKFTSPLLGCHMYLIRFTAVSSATPAAKETTPTRTEDQERKIPRKDMEPKLARLWEVYDRARAEYLAVADTNDVEELTAAKFLRDTGENTILYLTNKNVDAIMMAELEATYNMAKARVVSLTGGKKRKFDKVAMDEVKGVPRAPNNNNPQGGKKRRQRGYYYSSSTTAATTTTTTTQHDGAKSSDRSSAYGGMAYTYGPSSPNTASSAYTRYPLPSSSSPRRHGRGTSHSPPPQNPPRGANNKNQGRELIPMRGRGHSGIPYGYSRRDVDSYHPGGDEDEDDYGEGATWE